MNKVVTIEFTMKNHLGQVLDTSRGVRPLVFLFGAGVLVKGLEKAVEGKNPGDTIQVTLGPEEAYGIHRDELVQGMPRRQFAQFANPLPGMQFEARGPNGEAILVSIVEVQKDLIIADMNHPLAGLTLTFEVTVVDVREATEKELAEGRAFTRVQS